MAVKKDKALSIQFDGNRQELIDMLVAAEHERATLWDVYWHSKQLGDTYSVGEFSYWRKGRDASSYEDLDDDHRSQRREHDTAHVDQYILPLIEKYVVFKKEDNDET